VLLFDSDSSSWSLRRATSSQSAYDKGLVLGEEEGKIRRTALLETIWTSGRDPRCGRSPPTCESRGALECQQFHGDCSLGSSTAAQRLSALKGSTDRNGTVLVTLSEQLFTVVACPLVRHQPIQPHHSLWLLLGLIIIACPPPHAHRRRLSQVSVCSGVALLLLKHQEEQRSCAQAGPLRVIALTAKCALGGTHGRLGGIGWREVLISADQYLPAEGIVVFIHKTKWQMA